PRRPVFVYNNWSAYDELSDKVVQTEALAMQELNEILRLRKSGVQIDYYVMDAFWFDKAGGYRTWHREHWPNGPDKWLKACRDHQILPGMWFSSNLIATHDGRFLEPVPEWRDSVGTDPNILCLFEGGYLSHLADTLQLWYNKGVRLFKFDFAYFEAVTPASKDKFTPEEIKEKNKTAFMAMLQGFRARNGDVLITGYNGFGGDMENTFTPFRKTMDLRWLDVFDTLYCGDPRFSDVPMINSWRSQDTYSDHMVRQFEFNGLPLRRIDNCAFMIGTTGTCYYRGIHAWKGMLLLELARGGWMNVYHGNLELLDEKGAKWFARAQGLYHGLQKLDRMSTFGAVPGEGRAYGFKAEGAHGIVYTVVNPSQDRATIDLPGWQRGDGAGVSTARILYADGGFTPLLKDSWIGLGPEQLVVVATGEYADPAYDLGRDETIRIPADQGKITLKFAQKAKNTILSETLDMRALPGKDLRIFLQQFGADGLPVRSWGGAPPNGQKMDALLSIRVLQAGKELLLYKEYDKMIWSGLSWAAAELRHGSFDPAVPVEIECHSAEKGTMRLEGQVYAAGRPGDHFLTPCPYS
ncbi:MAG TPA: hypothetical protein VF939_11600, partial [Puia sp.]